MDLINKIDIETEEQANEIISECERNGGINISTLEDIMLVSKGDWGGLPKLANLTT